LCECGGLYFAQVAGDVVAVEDFAHRRLLLRAAGEGVGAVRKRQPLGGLIGLGTSPLRMMRFFAASGSGTGTADKSASV
jgi:hypothetical protein